MESFFGHMKEEVDFTDCQTIDEVRERVADLGLEYRFSLQYSIYYRL